MSGSKNCYTIIDKIKSGYSKESEMIAVLAKLLLAPDLIHMRVSGENIWKPLVSFYLLFFWR